MDQTAATLVFAGIMGLEFLVWLYSLIKTLRIGHETEFNDPWKPGSELPGGGSTNQTGERTVHGDPEKLSKALVRSMLQVNIGMFGSLFEVVELHVSPARLTRLAVVAS